MLALSKLYKKNQGGRCMRNISFGVLSGLFLAVFTAGLFVSAPVAQAAAEIVQFEGVSYNVQFSMLENLKTLVGKRVFVTIESGKTFAGKVKAVGEHLLHLEKIDGKDFFDALIRIDKISAIDTQFRGFKK